MARGGGAYIAAISGASRIVAGLRSRDIVR